MWVERFLNSVIERWRASRTFVRLLLRLIVTVTLRMVYCQMQKSQYRFLFIDQDWCSNALDYAGYLNMGCDCDMQGKMDVAFCCIEVLLRVKWEVEVVERRSLRRSVIFIDRESAMGRLMRAGTMDRKIGFFLVFDIQIVMYRRGVSGFYFVQPKISISPMLIPSSQGE